MIRSHRIRQEPVARPPAAVHRPASSNFNSTPWRFWHFLLILLATRPPCPDVPPCDPVCLQASPRRLAASGFSLEIQYANHTTSAQHILSAPLISSRAHPNSSHLVSSSTRLPCARGYPPPSPRRLQARIQVCVLCTPPRPPNCTHRTSFITFLTCPRAVLFVPLRSRHFISLSLGPQLFALAYHQTTFNTPHIPLFSPHPRLHNPAKPCMCLPPGSHDIAMLATPRFSHVSCPGLAFPSPSHDKYHTNHIAVSTAVRTELDGGIRPARSWYTH